MTNLGNDWKATVFAVDPVYIFVICPFCGEIHRHGSNGAIDSADYGHRQAHCRGNYSAGYYLVPNDFTIRSKDEIKVKDTAVLKRYRKACGISR